MALRVSWYTSPRIITIQAPVTDITIQDLTDQIKDIEDEPAHLAFPILVRTFGKESLGGGAFVGITAVLQNAQVAFEARPGPTEVICTITKGNLVAIDNSSNTINPIYPTAYTQVTIQQSTSPSIISPPEDKNMLYLLESLLGKNKTLGNIYYWDPNGGSDSNAGTQPSSAVLTFAQAQSLATAGNNDIIFCMSTAAGGITTVTQNLTITKNGLKVRGPGYALQVKPTVAATVPVTVTADNVEISGLYVQPAAGGSVNGITVTGDNCLIRDCWINSATNNGIDLSSTTRSTVQTCAIENSSSNGINIGNTTSKCLVSTCIISGSGADGANLSGSSITDNMFENNLIYNNTGYGIDIGSGVTRTGVRLHHTFSGNSSGETRDLGTASFIEATSSPPSAGQIADAVWDEVISGHTTAGTVGRTLKDAKTKATLASLK